ncbi:MAG: phage virion morphogenesis protein [Candidatus Abawacabacteria bacterium]|nr:phage virion morphogenesis protein [Candidatus Abawacabacteria bacterium]
MPRDLIEIEVKNDQITKALQELQSKTDNLEPLMIDISEIMKDAVLQNIRVGGNPEWPKLSPMTRNLKENKGFNPNAILQQEGRLKASITHKAGKDFAVAGTNIPYGPIHQFGGEIKPKKGKFLYVPSGKDKKGKTQFIRLKKAVIPARPFLKLQESDERDITNAIKNYLKS